MAIPKFQKALEAITSLGDPVRRRLYEAVAAAEGPVSRKEIATTTGVARPLAAYHLDRLVKEGLLETRFERQSGRVGPGAGRPAKLYFRPRSAVRVTLPPRDLEVAAQLLAEAVARRNDPEIRELLDQLAHEAGSGLTGNETSTHSDPDAVARLLAERGYEPRVDSDGTITLRNCVFDELASQWRDLVCPMNLSLIRGILDALPAVDLEAKLEPGEGRCCVVLSPRNAGLSS